MKNLDALQKYFFGGGDAESEKEIITDLYVNKPDFFTKFLNFEKNNFRLLIGPKGSGKTILLHYINQSLLVENMLSLIVSPEDYDTDLISSKKSNSEKVKEATKQLQQIIASKLAEGVKFSLKETDITLKKIQEEITGEKPVVNRIFNTLATLIPEDKIRIAAALKEITYINLHTKNVEKAINKKMDELNYKLVVMIDNIDSAVEEDNGKFSYSNCWAIVESAIKISHELKNVVFIISIRTDIWHLMTNVHNYGTSVVDKINNITKLKTDEYALKDIFNRRIQLAAKLLPPEKDASDILRFFYPENVMLSYGSQEYRTWDQWISKNSRNRARDMVHLVQEMIDKSKINPIRTDRITDTNRDSVLLPFALTRIDNISKEYYQICPDLKEVIKFFHKTEYSFTEMLSVINSACSNNVSIDGIKMKQDKTSALEVLRLLHMASFINPKKYLDEIKKRYQHILFEDFPLTINPDNYNSLQNYYFEVHPIFHSYIKNH